MASPKKAATPAAKEDIDGSEDLVAVVLLKTVQIKPSSEPLKAGEYQLNAELAKSLEADGLAFIKATD